MKTAAEMPPFLFVKSSDSGIPFSTMIDLRSDTVTRPTDAMRAAMASAEVGDDVFGDDPTVQQLEEMAAAMFGKEAGLFTASATQSNLVALLVHCGRGDEYIVGQQAHNYLYEGGGGAALGSIQPQPLNQEPDGTLDLKKVANLIKPDDFHFARTRLLSLENTTLGRVLPMAYLRQARDFVDKHQLALHLDGARIFNAAIASDCGAAEIAAPFDTITCCLSKGLGAPVGSVLVGEKEFIKEARRWRKVVGGGMRQSGIIAAAGIYALENNIERLEEDHTHAQKFAHIPGVQADIRTNMIFLTFPEETDTIALAASLKEQGILVLPGNPMRLVTHLDISEADADKAVAEFSKITGK
jgi:threonine aldolase